jgi:3-oxoacyl-[acyl-carrier-protein] synthase-3
MSIRIRKVTKYLPEQVVTNADLERENPEWDLQKAMERAGVESRHIAGPKETALDLAHWACLKLFQENPELPGRVNALIFCTQSGDQIMPPNACLLHARLELPARVIAFDYNLACSGYIYGLAMAKGLAAGGLAQNILLVTADTYSKYIHPRDRSTRVVFGDGAAISWFEACPEGEGLLDIELATWGKDYQLFHIPAGGCRLPASDETKKLKGDISGNFRTAEHIHMHGLGLVDFMKERVPPQVEDVLSRNKLGIGDVQLFIFHQASKIALELLGETLKIPAEKVFSNICHLGNTVSASIAIAIHDAMASGQIKPGDQVLLCGFGVGMSYGTALLRM